ncbi:MAG TPA: hypothetical protein VFW07_13865 [Parafilimonas sp.]|nr:hypothetical protein [Parafilimonas sp.]
MPGKNNFTSIKKFKLSKTLRQKIGFTILIGVIFYCLWHYFLVNHEGELVWDNKSLFVIFSSTLLAFVFLFNFKGILFDPQEYVENTTIESLVKKFRYRGVLFNNIAIILFVITLAVIGVSFYLIASKEPTNTQEELMNTITVKIGTSVILIFLVQILFKVFKYLLRVAAFYNARTDAIELTKIKEDIPWRNIWIYLLLVNMTLANLKKSAYLTASRMLLKAG